ncbi:nucleotide disphospho-sugar-binding domain-containing protein [Actinomadura harenae]|uniref:DUF1205 domain-containing protein n=1 Tax=Actinomadura harenae TaxID=2483351 RepID=A0A3M2M7U0_9ACTN|nr:nucleotide disphospho-sugar-binding domain-containing protein [Actinomadura harenae]RMI43178.1 DUF1205 domain-containing protein [Actinomadura harenae]
MRVLFVCYGPRPHTFPMVPLAWAFQLAGHDVRMAGPPAIAAPMSESGITGAIVGADADVSSFLTGGRFRPRGPEPGVSAEEALARFVDGIAPIAFLRAEAMVDELVVYASNWEPELVVYDPTTLAGPVAAEVIGVPAVCNLYGMVRQFRIEMEGLEGRTPRAEYVNLFKRFGREPLLDPAAWIDPCPPSLQWHPSGRAPSVSPATPRLSVGYHPYNGPGLVPDWLSAPARRPRVLVSWGTSSLNKLGPEVIEHALQVVEAAGAFDVEVVVTAGGVPPETLERFHAAAPHVRTVDWLPFRAMAEASAVVVHTGGTGVALTTAACGTPQLGIHKIPEGTFNSVKVADSGAGLHLPQAEADVATVRTALGDLLGDPSYRTGAERLRAEIAAQPTPAHVVRSLERLVAGAPLDADARANR